MGVNLLLKVARDKGLGPESSISFFPWPLTPNLWPLPMRWPLRLQILTPMAVILLITVGSVSVVNAWLAASRVRADVESQLRVVARTLENNNFPLESNVLRQASGLSGAELAVVDAQGNVVATSFSSQPPKLEKRGAMDWRSLQLRDTSTLGEQVYFHAAVKLDRRPVGGEVVELHIFYPETSWRQATRQAALGPLLIGAMSLVFVIGAAVWVAASVTKPVHRLQEQVQTIAGGNYQSLPLPEREDEVRDLAQAINQLAERLAKYEEEVRGNERLRTLSQLGSGIAHQVRNAATGCRIAIDLHERDCAQNGTEKDERLDVAKRQLSLIETHVQRLIALGKPAQELRERIELAALLEDTLELVRPMAKHLKVELLTPSPWPNAATDGDGESLQQMLVNLLINAIQATAGQDDQNIGTLSCVPPPRVALEATLQDSTLTITVTDNGRGMPDHVAAALFQPFVTSKPGGTGLGLSVARQTARQHGGEIRWERSGIPGHGCTLFIVELPNWHGWHSDR